MFVFRKMWRALFSWNTRFEIHPFLLLPTISALHFVISILMVFIPLSIFMIKNATINPPDTNAVRKTNETAHFQENSDHVAGVAIFADGVLYEPFLKLQKKNKSYNLLHIESILHLIWLNAKVLLFSEQTSPPCTHFEIVFKFRF